MKLGMLAATAALLAAAGSAEARVRYNITGVANAGETVELNFVDRWDSRLTGELSLVGGLLESAELTAFGTRTYYIRKPLQKTSFDFELSCAAPDDLPCSGRVLISDYTPTGFDTLVRTIPGVPPVGTPAGRVHPWGSKTFSTLTFTVADDADGPVSYAYKAEGILPEPSSWAVMILGFGMAGAALRRRSPQAQAEA